MKKSAWLCGVASFVLFLVSGCAVGNKYSYSEVSADIGISGNSAIAVATHDQREYVVSGDKKPQFVGLQRGGFGNPFVVTTASDRPLADDMTDVIAASLAKKGFKTVPVTVLYSDKQDGVVEKAKASNADRMIILTLKEWKTDTYQNVALQYDATVSVLDKEGKKLAEKNIKGRDNLGGSSWNPPAYARKAVPEAFKKKMEELLNTQEIAKSLQ